MKVKNVLLTGAGGKIGRAVLPELSKAGYCRAGIGVHRRFAGASVWRTSKSSPAICATRHWPSS